MAKFVFLKKTGQKLDQYQLAPVIINTKLTPR
ncbi:MAG: hypothetical protein RLZZ86_1342, partial [Cyanobacteriota bacterium]|jgi:hypothetical protein